MSDDCKNLTSPGGDVRTLLTFRKAETVANMAIVFLHQEDYLLQAQLDALERRFLACGGFRERLFAARLKKRAGDPAI